MIEYTKYYITTYTKWTHDHFISICTSRDDIQFQQVVLRNDEVYGQFLVRSSVKVFTEFKNGINSNNGLAYNIEYAPISAI